MLIYVLHADELAIRRANFPCSAPARENRLASVRRSESVEDGREGSQERRSCYHGAYRLSLRNHRRLAGWEMGERRQAATSLDLRVLASVVHDLPHYFDGLLVPEAPHLDWVLRVPRDPHRHAVVLKVGAEIHGNYSTLIRFLQHNPIRSYVCVPHPDIRPRCRWNVYDCKASLLTLVT